MSDAASAFDYDLFVIGAGSGGVRASRVSASYGARVAVAEDSHLGGTCVNVGCVPKKLFVYASAVSEQIEDAEGYGWRVESSNFDWSTLLANKNREIERLNGIYGRLLSQAGVDLHHGRARLVDRNTVDVDGQRFTAENILIAVGGWPKPLPVPGGELAVSSNEMFHLETLPRRAAIVGGGYIAVEFASILNGLGVETIVLYRGPLFLRGFDMELRFTLAEEMARKGIDIRFECDIGRIERKSDALELSPSVGPPIEVDLVLAAVGRAPETHGMGLRSAGVELDDSGAVVVDELGRSSVDNIWAIGDATSRGQGLTPVAIHEAKCFAATLFGGEPTSPDRNAIPTAIFTQPTLATVGLSEEQAAAEGHDVLVYQTRFRPLHHTLTNNPERTMMKLVVDRKTDRVLGVHILGPDAGEMLQGAAIAVKMGATKKDFDATVGIHPTSAEELVTMT